VSPEQATAVFDAVVEAGITYVDTAPWYGAGLSESRTGEYFKDKTGFTFSTKCGRIIKPVAEADKTKEAVETGYSGSFITDKYHKNIPVATYTAEGIRESFKQSCERMQMTSFQSLRLHDAENPERWAEATDGGGVEAMVALRAEGKIKEVSMGMNSSEYLLKYLRKYPAGTFDSIMMAGCFNLIDQDGVELLLECQKLGVKVTNVGIFASGALWGSTHYKYEGIPPAIVEKIKKWKELSEKYGLTLPQVALNFAVMPDVVEMVAFGCKKSGAGENKYGSLRQGRAIRLVEGSEGERPHRRECADSQRLRHTPATIRYALYRSSVVCAWCTRSAVSHAFNAPRPVFGAAVFTGALSIDLARDAE